MNPIPMSARRGFAAAGAAILLASVVSAFPPAPPHLVFGQVRDEQGNPLNRPGSEVWLDVDGSNPVKVPVRIDSEPGVNYRLSIPVDSGVTSDLYAPTAMRPTVPFRLRVKVGNATYLPIEMSGASALVTRPSVSSRVDLTLGIDSDGDGLPDAWERNLIGALGGTKTLADIRPDADDDADGLSNLQEYLAGTYAFDAQDGFDLTILSSAPGRSTLEFMAIRGRTYTVRASHDLKTWTDVPFRLSTDAASVPVRASLRATDTRVVRPVVEQAPDSVELRFFKVLVH